MSPIPKRLLTHLDLIVEMAQYLKLNNPVVSQCICGAGSCLVGNNAILGWAHTVSIHALWAILNRVVAKKKFGGFFGFQNKSKR